MKIEVLGTGCAKCEKLAAMAEATAQGLGVDFELVKVEELNEIIRRGVMLTPALMVNGQVKVSGKVPYAAEMTSILTSSLA